MQVTCETPSIDEIGSLVRNGAKWSLTSLLLRQLISIFSTAVLARLVLPAAFGLVAMVTTITGFFSLLDIGLSWATMERKEITHQQVAGLFWFGAIISTFFWLIIIICAPMLSRYFNQPDLSTLCIVLGSSMFLNSLATQPTALVQRKMQQRKLSIIDITAQCSSCFFAIWMAMLGAGIWALVGQLVIFPLVRLLCLLAYSGLDLLHATIDKEIFGLVSYGSYIGLGNFLNYFMLNSGSLIIGKYYGAVELGYYNRAFLLKNLPLMLATTSLSGLIIPALAALAADPERMANAYRKALRVVVIIGCPSGALLGVFGPELIRVLLGPRWAGSAPLLEVMAFQAAIMPVYVTSNWLLFANGKGKAFLFLSVLQTPLVVCVLAGWAIHYGTFGIAAAESILMSIPIPLFGLWFAHHFTNTSLKRTLKTILPTILVTITASTITSVFGIVLKVYHINPTVILITKSLVAIMLFGGLALRYLRPLPFDNLEARVQKFFKRS